MRVGFVRHGLSLANAAGWYSGHLDVELAAAGHAQAAGLVELLVEEPIAAVWSSDLVRARDTALPTARALGLPILTTPALRERDMGAWSGALWSSASPGLRAVLHTLYTRPPGGECLADVAIRALDWLSARPMMQGTTLLFAHGGTIRALLGLLDGLSDDEIALARVSNAAVAWREVGAGDWRSARARLDVSLAVSAG